MPKRKTKRVVTVEMYTRVMAFAKVAKSHPAKYVAASTAQLRQIQDEMRTLDPKQCWPGEWYEVEQPVPGQTIDQKLLGWRYCTALSLVQETVEKELTSRDAEELFASLL